MRTALADEDVGILRAGYAKYSNLHGPWLYYMKPEFYIQGKIKTPDAGDGYIFRINRASSCSETVENSQKL